VVERSVLRGTAASGAPDDTPDDMPDGTAVVGASEVVDAPEPPTPAPAPASTSASTPASTPPPPRLDAVPRPAVYRPVRGGNAFEETVERLLQTIKLGVVGYGERLPPERDLALQLGVSRTTLREAIRDLQRTGYVESRRGRRGGTFVRYQPADSAGVGADARTLALRMGEGLEDALAFRRVLEPGAAELAACRRLSPPQRAELTTRLRACAAADPVGYRQADSRLHLAIAEAVGSASLAAAVADVRMRLNDLLDAIPLLPRNIRHSEEQHARVVTAILAGDPVAARRAMAEHVDGTAALLRGFLG
jgi:DNA-binding FadR family transcriptional regulator